MKPLIGISCGTEKDKIFLHRDYLRVVAQLGALPLALDSKLFCPKKDLPGFAGIILSGGDDIDPWLFGEEPLIGSQSFDPLRDRSELELVCTCREMQIPLLGICRGMQLINIALGGDIYQDLPKSREPQILHWQKAERTIPTHSVWIRSQSKLAKIWEQKKLRVNSFHHQAVRKCAADLQITAWAADNLAEALENQNGSWVLGVQWHPEALAECQPIFAAFLQACQQKSGG
ncbi:MAG: gamma-glutamyl-gamma-aminobutyrate hydrolase family protein [Clostridia bacterium]|nr:gamma-glutamyl-gamma-aminobutyrate hydrolase family protein [Clostridia bacterium]